MKKIITFINNKICEHKGHDYTIMSVTKFSGVDKDIDVDVVCNRCGYEYKLYLADKEWIKHIQKEFIYK